MNATDEHGFARTESVFVRVHPWLFLVLIAALVLRLIGLRYGLPAVYNPDEVAIMSRALAFAKGDPNPHNFLYPTLYFYVLFLWEGMAAIAAVATHAVASFGAFQREFFLDPTRVFVAGRLLTALLGTATVAATFALARRIGGPVAGIAAAVAVAVSPLHVRDSHYVKHDVPVTLLIVLAYLAYERLWRVFPSEPGAFEEVRKSEVIWAAVLTGLAFSTHYYAIFLAIPLAWSAARRAATTGEAIRRIAIAALVSAAIFFLCSPFILVEPGVALRDIQANRQIVVDRAVGTLGYAATLARYATMLARESLGWPFVAVAGLGTLMLLRDDARRAAWLFAFPVPFFFFIASTYPASRYLIPLVPFLAVLAGVAIAAMAQWDRRAAWVIVGLLAWLPLQASVRTDLFFRQTDTRTLAKAFIETHVPADATVLTQPYSVPLETSAAALREAVAKSGKEMPTKTRLQIERDPYPAPAYRLVYLGQGMDADKLYLPLDALGTADPSSSVRSEHVAFVVLKRYNDEAPAMQPLTAALARDGRRLAVFSPYREGAATRPEPFLHNTDARITAALERSGPVVEIWQLNGPGS
jgi:Dolichyl-phosphate-mannose-protein mannosyltransferase